MTLLSLACTHRASVDICAVQLTSQFHVRGRYYSCRRDGYEVHRKRLAKDLWHVVAKTKQIGFIPDVSPASVLSVLLSDRYTTPVLGEWASWLYEELLRRGNLRMCYGFGQSSGILGLTNDQLDDLMSDGVRSGELRIE